MYIDCVYEVVYTFILIVYKGGIYVYMDCVYEVVYTCLSESRTLIYTDICHGLFCVQLFEVRNDRLCYDS